MLLCGTFMITPVCRSNAIVYHTGQEKIAIELRKNRFVGIDRMKIELIDDGLQTSMSMRISHFGT